VKLKRKSEKPGVVLDTNIIVSALISTDGAPAEVFEHLVKGDICNYTSIEILQELDEVIKRLWSRVQDIYNDSLQQVLSNSIIVESVSLPQLTKDPKDNMFIECAVSANAKYIISGDKHLLEKGRHKNVKILNARELLSQL